MSRYERVFEALAAGERPTMSVSGQSMMPIIKSGSKLTFAKTDDYQIGDVVMARVRGRVIDAHKITKIADDGRCMISNNRGHDNGWASQIFGRVVEVNGEAFGRPLPGS